MRQAAESINQQVLDMLMVLRDEQFRPKAWLSFFVFSWKMARQTANQHPPLKRSWLHTSIFLILLALMILLLVFSFEGPETGIRLLPVFIFCVGWQICDLYWHLGLNHPLFSNRLFLSVGVANTLTLIRGVGASFLLARLASGLATSTALVLPVFLCAIASDILDGQIARSTKTQSKLGQILDGEADLFLFLAITLILVQHAMLPSWFILVVLFRFFLPMIAAIISYFALTRPVRFGSTRIGKYAGIVQSLYYCVLLAPPPFTILGRSLNVPLMVLTFMLLVVAPFAQFWANLRSEQ
jgi:phosphatidylglycerophosphate synthase